ncbi:MAG: DUF2141 domain-containing protein, partial [Sphingomonadales bacterium]|nr:DUF2141 domain-containing protein [Sphingomonadales bacterium]
EVQPKMLTVLSDTALRAHDLDEAAVLKAKQEAEDALKDRSGKLKLEVYPSNDTDFLADDNVLVAAGKTFRRVEVDTPNSGAAVLCVRIPGPGTYSVSVLHDRDNNRKFGWKIDGIGFSGNPKLGWSKPKASKARVVVNGAGVSRITVVMNYKSGLGVAPLKK